MNRIVQLLAGAGIAFAGAPALSAEWTVHDLGTPNDRVTDIRIAAVNDRGEIAGAVTMTGSTPVPERAAFVYGRGGFHLFGESLNTPPTVPKDINASGVVVGKDFLPFLYDEAKTPIPGLNQFSSANALNDRGHVVGSMQVPNGAHAYVYADGGLTDLGTLGGSNSHAFGINRRGDVVGYSTLSDEGYPKAFVRLAGGAMMPLGNPLGGRYSVAYAINDRGEIAGSAETEHLSKHGFLHRDGMPIDLGVVPGTQSCDAIDLNNRAEVVGICGAFFGSEPVLRPFLWRDGRMIDLAALPEFAAAGFTAWHLHGELVGASYGEGPGVAINDRGQIVGAGLKDGKLHLFLLSPRGPRK